MTTLTISPKGFCTAIAEKASSPHNDSVSWVNILFSIARFSSFVVKVVEFASMSIEANRQGLTATEESFLVCVDRWVCRQEARYLRERLLDSKLKLNNEAVASLIE